MPSEAMSPRRRVLVTGGLGFIGSEVCRRLADTESEITVVDDMAKGKAENIASVSATIVQADVRDNERLRAVVADFVPDVVLHLAAMHHIPECNREPVKCMDVNVVGTESLLAALRPHPPARLIVTSSMAVYPIGDGPHRETDPVGPIDVYGQSKLMNEMQARRFCDETGVTTAAVRLSNVYGPRETNPHVIPEIMRQLKDGSTFLQLGNIEPKRDYTYTTDAANAFQLLATANIPTGFHVVNVGTGVEYSVRELLRMLSEITGKAVTPVVDPVRLRKVERMHLLPDIGAVRRLVGWTPKVEMREGLRRLCEWYGLL